MSDEMVSIPRVLGVNLNINFFGEMKDPALVMNLIISDDFMGDALAHHAGLEGQMVIPVAFLPEQLQQLVPPIIEAVLRARTIQEMITTWPEQRAEIMENLLFRWATTLEDVERGDDGDQTEE
jgi:hypothetical protein